MSTTHRTKISIYLDNTIHAWVLAKKEDTGINFSRLIEKAILEVHGKEIKEFAEKQKQDGFKL